MRAGKRLDPFPNSYTGDPLAAYRLNIAKAGFPSWMMLSMDELGRVPDPTPELLAAAAKYDEEKQHEADQEKKREAAKLKITEAVEHHESKNKHK